MALVAMSPPPMSALMDVDRDLGRGSTSSRMYAPTYASPPTSPAKSEGEPTVERAPESDPSSVASDVANAASSSPAAQDLLSSSSSSSPPNAPPDASVSSSPFAAASAVFKQVKEQDSANGGGGLRRAKDLPAFMSLLPPVVEFVEGSSRGALASLEGRYEPINVPPKEEEEKEGEQNRWGRSASVNGKTANGSDKAGVSDNQNQKSTSAPYYYTLETYL